MIGLALLHGWGLGPESLARICAAFPDRPSVLLDAGYFNEPVLGLPDNPDGWVGVGHSLGFATLAAADRNWRGLVGLNAFAWFCAGPDRPAGTRPEIVEAMLARLTNDPADVLRRFRKRCGFAPGEVPVAGGPGLERLTRDLQRLFRLDIRPELDRLACPVLVLAADDDRINATGLTDEGFGGRPNVRIRRFESGGHALPETRGEACAKALEGFLDALS